MNSSFSIIYFYPNICITMIYIFVQLQIPASNLRKVINSRNTITSDQCAGRYTEPTHLIDLDAGGFVGVYEPDPNLVIELFTNNTKGNYTGNITGSNFSMYIYTV